MDSRTAQNLSANYTENVNQNVLNLRLNTTDHLDEIERFLRSVQPMMDVDKKTGKRVYKLVQVSDPLANDEGVKGVLFIVRNLMNQHVVQGNFKDEDYKDYICSVRKDIASIIMENLKDWKIEETNYNLIIDTIMMFVKPFMTRTLYNKERESYGASLQMREVSSISEKGGLNFFR